jgi:hypothetical protein
VVAGAKKTELLNVNIPVLTPKTKKTERLKKGKKYLITGMDANDISTFIVPPLTPKQKKVLQTPVKAGWEEITPKKSVAKHKPKTLAKFTSIAELKVMVISKNEYGSVEMCYNKITKNYHWRKKGRNGEILCQCESMFNKSDAMSNLILSDRI